MLPWSETLNRRIDANANSKTKPSKSYDELKNSVQQNCSDKTLNASAVRSQTNGGWGWRDLSVVQPAWRQLTSVWIRIRMVASSDMWDVFLVRLLMAVSIMLYYSKLLLSHGGAFSAQTKGDGLFDQLQQYVGGPCWLFGGTRHTPLWQQHVCFIVTLYRTHLHVDLPVCHGTQHLAGPAHFHILCHLYHYRTHLHH